MYNSDETHHLGHMMVYVRSSHHHSDRYDLHDSSDGTPRHKYSKPHSILWYCQNVPHRVLGVPSRHNALKYTIADIFKCTYDPHQCGIGQVYTQTSL